MSDLSQISNLLDKPFYEFMLHYIWQEKIQKIPHLKTKSGKSLNIIFPGWYNKGWGPDFKNARLKIDQEVLFGDIEIHCNENDWNVHKHHENSNYTAVILHVFINSSKKKIYKQNSQSIEALILEKEKISLLLQQEKYLAMSEPPGACGLKLNHLSKDRVLQILAQSSEHRILEKTKTFEKQIETSNSIKTEQLLFQAIFKSIGYSAFSNAFEELATTFSYQTTLHTLKAKRSREAMNLILSKWLGSLNLLEQYSFQKEHPNIRRQWRELQTIWKQSKYKTLENYLPKTAYRPQNNPIIRLFGFYSHLQKTSFHGLFKSWLLALKNLEQLNKDGLFRIKQIFNIIDTLFPKPNYDLPECLNISTTKYEWIGKQRKVILFVNAILPFFLAWSKKNNDTSLEKILFQIYLLLPGEGKNKKTNFMENRLMLKQYSLPKKTTYYQGLIYLYDHCCHHFYEGCQQCSFLKSLSLNQEIKSI